jgi:hypothetical protein
VQQLVSATYVAGHSGLGLCFELNDTKNILLDPLVSYLKQNFVLNHMRLRDIFAPEYSSTPKIIEAILLPHYNTKAPLLARYRVRLAFWFLGMCCLFYPDVLGSTR